MKKLIYLLCIIFMISGCSLLKIASSPFKNTVSKVPEKIEKSKLKDKCNGNATFYQDGSIKSCTKGYYKYEETFNKVERKLKWREKISQFFLNAKGYLLWGAGISIALVLSGFGWVFGAIWSAIRGAGKVAKEMSRVAGDLVRGISKGKKYIRSNGNKYSPDERKIYQQALDDMMAEISKSVNTKKSKEIINFLRVNE